MIPKCPKCMRGKWGKQKQIKGVHVDNPTREKWCSGRRIGKVLRKMAKATCNDCGHTWWTTLCWQR